MLPPKTVERRLKVLLCGYGHLGLSLLQGLLSCADRCEIVGVYRWLSRTNDASYWEPVETVFQDMVRAHGLPDIVCPGINHYAFMNVLAQYQPDVTLIGSWGEILKPHLLDRKDVLFVNCHPSKLPAHRGANPYASVILADEKETGVTFHRMTPEIDAGAILLQKTIPLTAHETGDTLRLKCAAVTVDMTHELTAMLYRHCIENAPLEGQEQDETLKSYYPSLTPESGLIPWQEDARGIYRHCRAMFPWVACYGYLEGRRMIRLFSPRFTPRVPPISPSFPEPGGTILSYRGGMLRIALSDPYWMIEVPLYQTVDHRGAWPIWLCRLLAPFWFRPGRRFSSVSHKDMLSRTVT